MLLQNQESRTYLKGQLGQLLLQHQTDLKVRCLQLLPTDLKGQLDQLLLQHQTDLKSLLVQYLQ